MNLRLRAYRALAEIADHADHADHDEVMLAAMDLIWYSLDDEDRQRLDTAIGSAERVT